MVSSGPVDQVGPHKHDRAPGVQGGRAHLHWDLGCRRPLMGPTCGQVVAHPGFITSWECSGDVGLFAWALQK